MSGEIAQRSEEPAFWISAAVYTALDPGEYHRSSTHGTWLQGDVDRAAFKPPAPDCFCGKPHGKELSVAAWILVQLSTVVRGGNDLAFVYNHGPDRDISKLWSQTSYF